MGNQTYLVTGASGCIGAWVVAELIRSNERVVALDVAPGPGRLRLLLDSEECARVEHVVADVTDLGQLLRIVNGFDVTKVIHLAALQVPLCRADPPRGGLVNVVGTLNVLEAAKRTALSGPVVYASSVAALATSSNAEIPTTPATHYGVFKQANEGTAAVYWGDDRVSSIGLRPHTVYGPGRDQGVTSAPTQAMLAAASGVSYRIPYGGDMQLHYARDVATAFIAASRLAYEGASVHNLPGAAISMSSVIEAITTVVPNSAGLITHDDITLPFPPSLDPASFNALVGEVRETPLLDGVRETVERFQRLMAEGLFKPETRT